MGVSDVPSITRKFSLGGRGTAFPVLQRKRTEDEKEGGLTASVAGGYESSYMVAYVYFFFSH